MIGMPSGKQKLQLGVRYFSYQSNLNISKTPVILQ